MDGTCQIIAGIISHHLFWFTVCQVKALDFKALDCEAADSFDEA